MRKIYATLLTFILIACASFNASAQKDPVKRLLGQWEYVKYYVTTEPRNEVMEQKIARTMKEVYPPHSFDFIDDSHFIYHTDEGSSEGKYMAVKNRILFSDKGIDFGVDRFIQESSFYDFKKNRLVITTLQSDEAVKQASLFYATTFHKIAVSVEYKKYKAKKK